MVERVSNQPTVFITGATGFIGRRVLAVLASKADRQIRCLVHENRSIGDASSVSAIRGELDRPDTFAAALTGVHTVLHLAARTGRGSRQDHFKTNRDGTAQLLRAARDAGVVRFINVSSIASTFQQRAAYHYADAKSQAEELVRASGLRFVNVRPTLVFGPGSPVGQGLLKIATLPIVPLFGGGTVRVQPIHVDDVAEFLVAALDDERLDNHDVDLGGAESLTMKELLQRMRRAARGSDPTFVPVPGLATMRALAIVEPVLGKALPVSAGQLSAFVNDSDVKATVPGAMPERFRFTLEEMIRDSVMRAEPGDDRLAGECRLFCRYLADVDATPDVVRAYERAHAVDSLKLHASAPLDRALLRLANTGAAFTRLADSFAGAAAPASALRRKLVILTAILESRGASAMNVDHATDGSLAAWIVTTGLYGLAWLFRFAVAAVLLMPLRLWYGVSASR